MRVQQAHASVGGMMVTMVCVLYPRPNYHSRLLNIHSQAWTTVYIPEAKWAADEEAPAELRAANTSLRGTVPLHFNTVVSAAECLGTLACNLELWVAFVISFSSSRGAPIPPSTHTQTRFFPFSWLRIPFHSWMCGAHPPAVLCLRCYFLHGA